ncbi:superinfection immunity protein [Paraburkholderia phytofirmans]|uniref:superinfection immunity protein n=1 Tax=Paraburkholderia phytofirmans TaxID=261302 RepID=UPI0009EDF10D
MKQFLEGVGLLAAMTLYLVCAVGAHARNHPDAFAITVVSMLIGWTVIGWGATSMWRISEARVSSGVGSHSVGSTRKY